MELELHQLTLRYERLRKRSPGEERALLVSSLSEISQQLPVAERLRLTGYRNAVMLFHNAVTEIQL